MKRMVALLPVLIAFQAGAPPALAWTWPVDGPVLRPFEFGDDPYAAGHHRGLDVGTGTGTGGAVRAPVSGVVSFAGTVPGGGRSLTLQTSDGLSVTLVHLGGIAVARTVRVEEGAVVGQAGPSGEAEHPVPYVHLGVRRTAEADAYLDPLGFLPPRTPAKAPAATAPPPLPAPAPGPAPAPKAGPVLPVAAAPDAPHASASPSHNGQPRGAHAVTRSERPEAVPDTAPRAAGLVAAVDAATASPRHPPAPSTTRRAVPDSFGIPAPEASASSGPQGEVDRPAHGAGSQAVPTSVVLLVAGLGAAVLAALGIAAVRLRRQNGSSPEAAGPPSHAPDPVSACDPVKLTSQPSARLPRAASPRCAARGGPHRPPRRRMELVAGS